MLKVAVIGAGNIAVTAHIPCYNAIGNVEIAGITDLNQELAEKIAAENRIPNVFSSAEIMLDSLKPDIVSICVPNKFHFPFAMLALEKGCHVFCEKPPAMTVEEAFRMEAKAIEKGKILYYGFQNRFTQEFIFAHNYVEDGNLGKISHAKAKWLRRRGIPGWGVFTNRSVQGGGALLDIGIHMLDMALNLLDYPKVKYVSATMSDDIGKKGGIGDFGPWDGEKYTVEDNLFGFIVFENGVSLTLETSFALNQKEKTDKNIILYGDKTGISLFPVEIYENGNTKNILLEDRDARLGLMKDFVMAVEGKSKPMVTAKQGTYVQNIVMLLYESAETGKPVFSKILE